MAVVLDIGAESVAAGVAGDTAPRVISPNVAAYTGPKVLPGMAVKEWFVGEEALAKRGVLRLRRPLDRWRRAFKADMEGHLVKVLEQAFADLGVSPSAQPALLTEPPLQTSEHRERMASVLLTQLRVPALLAAPSAELAARAAGCTTALVVELESEFIAVSAVHEGQALERGVRAWEHEAPAGVDTAFDEHLANMLNERGYNFGSYEYGREEVRAIRKQLAYVALDTTEEAAKGVAEISYELKDGQEVTVGSERFLCMEPLFAPAAVRPSDGFHPVFGSEGLAKMAHDAVMSCDDGIRCDLLSNVILSGGLSECPGIAERLQKELAPLFPSDQPPATVKALPERRLLPWVGGSMLASLPQFNGMCRTNVEP